MACGNVSIIIPAYRPGPVLLEITRRLAAAPVSAIIVVDDGSGPEYSALFDAVEATDRVCVLRHAVNLGKGAALKTGMNYALCTLETDVGAVTADADGQHDPGDIIAVAEALTRSPNALVLGVRAFDKGVPLRSRLGNRITRSLLRAVNGQRISDTQTGLRGIPRELLRQLLRIPSTGYEFELDMLIACKHQACPIREVPVRTIYLDGNRSSHFNPLLDSMRIYFVLLRFSVLSLVTALIDNIVFLGAFSITASLGQSQIAGRALAMLFNYSAARHAVFFSRERHVVTLPRYVLLVSANGVASFALIVFLNARLGWPVVWAKVIVEILLFAANFILQRDFVFSKSTTRSTATDWDRYYESVPLTARLTRRYTTRTLVRALRRFARTQDPRIIEIGGANSCFVDDLLKAFPVSDYQVIDNNKYGLELLHRRTSANTAVTLANMDVLDINPSSVPKADVVFSVGLIEHFAPEDTAKAIDAHFDLLHPGGCVLLSFPTPTWLYRVGRRIIEMLGAWNFPDERPLSPEEVIRSVRRHGEVLLETTLWPLILTQQMIVARKIAPSEKTSVLQGAVSGKD